MRYNAMNGSNAHSNLDTHIVRAQCSNAHSPAHRSDNQKHTPNRPQITHGCYGSWKCITFPEFNGIQQNCRSLLSLVHWIVWSSLVFVVLRDTTSSQEVAKTSSADGVYICYHLCITYWTINSDSLDIFPIRYPSTFLVFAWVVHQAPCPLSTWKYGFCRWSIGHCHQRCVEYDFFFRCVHLRQSSCYRTASIDALCISISFCRWLDMEEEGKIDIGHL